MLCANLVSISVNVGLCEFDHKRIQWMDSWIWVKECLGKVLVYVNIEMPADVTYIHRAKVFKGCV